MPIMVESGIRQACPLSLILFTCVMEALNQSLRQHPGINRVQIPGEKCEEVRVLVYMEDLNILCMEK